MQTGQTKNNPLFHLIVSLLMGLVVGALTLVFINLLTRIEVFHQELNSKVPYHLILIPFVLIIIMFLKRNTLYFPFRVAELEQSVGAEFWSKFMLPFHYIGTLLSHISGVSVGREGAVVLFSAGLLGLFKMSWRFWGPIVSSIGFSAVVGNYWVAPFFISELFPKISFLQKIYAFLGAMVAVLFIKSFNFETLINSVHTDADINIGFINKFIYFFVFAAMAGLLMRIYKHFYFVLSDYFKKSGIVSKILVSMVLAGFLFLPEFRKFQSLGLYQISDLTNMQSSFFDVISKLFVTLISTSLGFCGGEFIPLLFAGTHFGYSFFTQLGLDALLGSGLGIYLLFAGATRFKWTSYWLMLGLMGFGWWFWGYYIINICLYFSGERSLYKKSF